MTTRSIHNNLRGSVAAPGAITVLPPPPPTTVPSRSSPQTSQTPPTSQTSQPTASQTAPAQNATQTAQQDVRRFLPKLPSGFEWVPKQLQPGEQPAQMQLPPEARLPVGWQWSISQIIPPAPPSAVASLPLNHPQVQGVLMRTPENLAVNSCQTEAQLSASISALKQGPPAMKKRGAGAIVAGLGIAGLAAVGGVVSLTGIGSLIFWAGVAVLVYDYEKKKSAAASNQNALVQNRWSLHSHINSTHPERTYRVEQVY